MPSADVYSPTASLTDGDDGTSCARGEWCSGTTSRLRADGTRERVPARTYTGFCMACETRIGGCLDELPQAYRRLHAELGEPHSRRTRDVRSALGPSLPLRADIDALQRYMAVTLCGWEARVRRQARLSPRDPARPVHTAQAVTGAATVLRTHLSVLLALPAAGVARDHPLPPGRRGHRAPPLPEELVRTCGHLEMLRLGVDYIRLMVDLDGTDAGLELLDMGYRARSVLGETRPPRESLDGVPCRSCEAMGSLERAEPPSDPAKPAPWSVCAECGATMPEDEYRGWSAWYAGWAKGVERTCARCAKGDCAWCEYGQCECRAAGHGVPLAA